MVKTFEQFHEMDPYGEEQWENDDLGDKTLGEIHAMLTNERMPNLEYLRFSDEPVITFKLDYPHRGILNFSISRNLDGEISLCCDNLIGMFTIDSVVLNSTSFEEFWDKLTDLVEKNMERKEYY